ncbi:MAG: DUF4062 domain-containing protein [Anaerolineaceae bacterium]|nr:DUF4062 domain-containing protein [Anaerolineaceae bacterium]
MSRITSRNLPLDVMISSTSRDLPLHRERATRVVLKRGLYPRVMESLPAADRDAITVSLDMVNEAEIYVGIFGRRYGHIPDDPRNPDGISITEMEYRRALERGIPVLCFVMSDDHPAPATVKELETFIEQSEEGKKKLRALIDEITSTRVVSFFESDHELGEQILNALYDEETIEKAKSFLPPGVLEAFEQATPPPAKDTIPTKPEFYARPAYAGGMGFVGRKAELTRLDAWAQAATPVMVVEAIGGQGKSALTWHWVERNKGNFDGVVWWSFYTQGTTMTDFLRHTLAYVTGRPLDDVPRDDHEARTELLQALRDGRYLLALDGLERVLTAYHRLDAAMIRDDQVEEDKRAATNPRDTETLAQLLTAAASKILVSTRLFPRAWEARYGGHHENTAHILLEGLSPEDALALAEQAHITVTDDGRVTRFLERFGFHPLVVGALLGVIGNPRNRRFHRSFDAWLDANERDFSLRDLDLRGRQTHIVGYAIAGLSAPATELLARLALFRDAVPYAAMTALGVSADPQAIDGLLLELEDSGLVMYDPQRDQNDLHPVVRGYGQDLLAADERRAAFSRLYDYFEAQPEEDYDAVTEVAQLNRSLEVVRALQGAGRLDDALGVYKGFGRTLFFNLGSYAHMRALLEPFFPDGLDAPPALANARDRSWVMNSMAQSLQLAGDPAEAVPLYLAAVAEDLGDSFAAGLAVKLRNAAKAMLESRSSARARRLYAYSLRVALAAETDVNNNRLNVMIGAVSRGDWAAALEQYGADKDNADDGAYVRYRAEMAAARDEPDALDILRRALEMNLNWRRVRYVMEIHYAWALYALGQGDPAGALPHAQEAVRLARQTNDRIQGAALAVLGQIHAALGDFATARDYLAQAGRAVCSPIFEVERELAAAHVHHLAGERDAAVERALAAYRLAWADGESDHPDHKPGYTIWWPLHRARALLAELGVTPPDLPQFDPATIPADRLPIEDDIEAFIAELEAKQAERERKKTESTDEGD